MILYASFFFLFKWTLRTPMRQPILTKGLQQFHDDLIPSFFGKICCFLKERKGMLKCGDCLFSFCSD